MFQARDRRIILEEHYNRSSDRGNPWPDRDGRGKIKWHERLCQERRQTRTARLPDPCPHPQQNAAPDRASRPGAPSQKNNNMEITLVVLALMILFLNLVLAWRVLATRKPAETAEDKSMLLLQNQLNELNRTMDAKLSESTRAIQTQFGQSANMIQSVTERLTKLDETNRQVVNFADQLQSLQDILKNPKQRGVLGEYYLDAVLANVLPPGVYQTQYHLGRDEDSGKELIPDAVIFLKDKIVPVDSKFSLENYNRLASERDPLEREKLEKLFRNDLKTRIDETSKYIRPDLGTMDFAFMFIPHEAIYYDLLVGQVGAIKSNAHDLIEYAFKEKHVIIVSPTSFLAYLQTVNQGLKALQIEESAKEIRRNVELLAKHLMSYETYLRKLGTHLGTAVNMYNSSFKEFKKVDKDVLRITGEAMEIEPLALERPQVEEME